ncbi:MAG: PLP-dependent aminotransferase family protein, partial [Chloroflexi bacterium]
MRQNTNQHQPLPLFTASICSLIQLDRSSDTPLYQQISDKIREAILSGQLAEGIRLPTERALASALQVNRTTVMNAYNQLAADGLVEGHVGRGTLVKRSQFNYLDDNYDANGPSWLFGLPTTEREILGPDARMLSELASVGDVIISLAAGTPAIELLPAEMLNAIFADVEVPTYLGAIQTFRALGARVIGVPTDSDGMRVDLLETILARHRPRLIYTLPTFQNPTGVVMSPERRRRLLLLARRYQTPILEDDPYSEVYFEGKQPQPLKSLDTHSQVIYLSTFSKILAPGLRVAWLAAAEPMIERLTLHKQIFDLNTNALGQWTVSEILQRDSLIDNHLAKLRHYYQNKRDLMLQAIRTHLRDAVRVNPPGGGFHLWCRLQGDVRARALLREATREHVAFVIGEPFHVDGGGQQHFRLG